LVVAEPKAITAGGNGSIASTTQRELQIGPSIGCDQQIEGFGFVAHNELTLSGWATSPHGVSGVVVQIDDRSLNAAYGLDTSWLAGREGDVAAGRAGFQLSIDTAEWAPGRREVKIVAFDQAGGRAELSGQVEILPYETLRYSPEEVKAAIAAGETVMWLERPPIVEGSCEVGGPLEISGWAYARDGLESVRVTLDDRTMEALRPIVRPDLLEEHGAEMAGVAGFVLSLDPSECPPGPHRLTVVAVGPGGRGVGVSGDLVCRAEPGRGKPEAGRSAEIEWIEDRVAPRERGDAADRYRPPEHAGSLFEVEHQLRYRWAAQLARGRTVLDAGCGFGWGTAMLAEGGAERVCGVDSSEEALAEARERTADLTVELEQADLGALPFDDASFDLIVCLGALERAADRELALEELRRVLRPEGVLLISSARRKAGGEGGSTGGYTPLELERALRGRFANVRLHRQLAHLASTVLDDEASAVGDGEAVPGVDLRKLAVGRPGGEDHTLAVAGEGPLPELGRLALLAPPGAIQRVHDSARTWEDRALHAEAEAAATRVQVNLARMHQEAATKVLRERDREQAELEAAWERLAEQETKLAEQDKRLREQEERIWAQHEQIERQAGLEERLREQDERLSEQDERIWAQHEQIEGQAGLEERLREQDERIWAQDQQIEQQHEQLAQRDALLDSQAATLGARNAELRVTAERMRRAEAEAAAWRGSSSARVTRPLRAFARSARRVRNAVFRRSQG
jgi:SAM-dependent methyltransferase